MKLQALLTTLVLRAVPQHLRDSVHGDLLEQGAGVRTALALALHFQVEPYQARPDRRAALALLLAAAGLLWLVPLAVHSLLTQATVFDGAATRAVLQVWKAPAVLAAVAGGLLVGRASLLPAHADAARLHMVLVLAPLAALAAPSTAQALCAAALLPAAAGLAFQNRKQALGEPGLA